MRSPERTNPARVANAPDALPARSPAFPDLASRPMIVSMIAALTRDRLLGNPHGGIPWDLPRDRAHFRGYTDGKWLLVGRRTYGEMGGWFGERRPIVLTRSPQSLRLPAGHRAAGSVPAAIDLAKGEGARELVVCGGAQTYGNALPWAERLVLTFVEFEIAAAPDSPRFPEWTHDAAWRTLARETWAADGRNKAGATLLIFARRSPKPLRSEKIL